MAARLPKPGNRALKMQLVREEYGGDLYEYYPLGQYVVAAPGVCGGRPSIKYTRIDARHIIGSLRSRRRSLRSLKSLQDPCRCSRRSHCTV